MFPSIDSVDRRFAFLHWVLRGEFPTFNGTIKTLRHPTAISPHFVFLRLAIPWVHSLSSLLGRRVHCQGQELVTRCLHPGSSKEQKVGLSQVPGEPQLSVCTCSNPTPAGLLAPDHCSAAAWPLNPQLQRLLRLGLSALNSMAFGFAVYASQCGLLQHHARLASSCSSGSTGRAFHPHGSAERFQSCQLHLILLSQACLAQ